MKKCPFCSKENYKEKYFCEACGSYMGSDHAGGLPPSPSSKAKTQMQKQQSVKPIKRKPLKTPEYVHLYHGGIVKKSTYNWLKKKNEDAGRAFLLIVGISLLTAILSRCS